MKKYVILILLLISLMLLTFNFNNVKEENNKEISKVEKILEKPEGIQAYTLNGEKTDLSYKDLIEGYEIDSITCKNGTIATYNITDNSINLSNIHMPDYCTMDFKEKPLITLHDKILEDNPTISERTDFSAIYTETNTGTLFKSTESIAGSTAKDVYYFAGDAKNNWVKFANFYWRIIRTNHDGSVRLLYSGTTTDTTEGYIGTSAFNTEYNSPKYVGYMYGNSDSTLDEARTNTNDSTIKGVVNTWYSNNLNTYSKYISTAAVYCNDREVGSGTYVAQKELNKNSNNMIALIDIADTSNLIAAPEIDPEEFKFSVKIRLSDNAQPTYNCTNSKDAFSGSNSEAKLTYPIGLMTADEIIYAGGYGYTNLTSPYAWYYLNSAGGSITGSAVWWLLSPYSHFVSAGVCSVEGSDSSGELRNFSVNVSSGVRPVTSIIGDVLWSSGDGSPENPYEIVYN